MAHTPSIRDVLAALDWVRGEMMRRGSPDFIRQREAESRVTRLCQRLLRPHPASATTDRPVVRRTARSLPGDHNR